MNMSKGYEIKKLVLSNLKNEPFSPYEIKENFTQTQIENLAEILGLNKDVLIQFNNDMKAQGKPINRLTLEEWALNESISSSIKEYCESEKNYIYIAESYDKKHRDMVFFDELSMIGFLNDSNDNYRGKKINYLKSNLYRIPYSYARNSGLSIEESYIQFKKEIKTEYTKFSVSLFLNYTEMVLSNEEIKKILKIQ